MNILISPDSYKGSLSSIEVGEAIKRGLLRAMPDASCTILPLADGGEGTLDAILYGRKGERIKLNVTDALGRPHQAEIAIDEKKELAVIEVATIVGLPLISEADRNPLSTTTYGLGQAVLHCLDLKISTIMIGLGGSATNDGGAGLLEALGAGFYREGERYQQVRAGHLGELERIDLSGLDQRLRDTEIIVACDVDNPLCGPKGASAIFGPQKGATPEMVAQLDKGVEHYAKLMGPELEQLQLAPGAGAAGGLGFAALVLGGQLKPGAELITRFLPFEAHLPKIDVLITGEGLTDNQTAHGKGPMYLAQQAKAHGAKVIILSGGLGEEYEALYEYVDALFSVTQRPVSLQDAMSNSVQWIEACAFNVGRLLRG